jgi:hypothetical protein
MSRLSCRGEDRRCGQFKDGKSADEAAIETCSPCHEPAKAHDFVYTRYAANDPTR